MARVDLFSKLWVKSQGQGFQVAKFKIPAELMTKTFPVFPHLTTPTLTHSRNKKGRCPGINPALAALTHPLSPKTKNIRTPECIT